MNFLLHAHKSQRAWTWARRGPRRCRRARRRPDVGAHGAPSTTAGAGCARLGTAAARWCAPCPGEPPRRWPSTRRTTTAQTTKMTDSPLFDNKYKMKNRSCNTYFDTGPPNLVLFPHIWYLPLLSIGYLQFFYRPISPNGSPLFFLTVVKFLLSVIYYNCLL
jgi:hypothetical protein